jgi:hypothetical protein
MSEKDINLAGARLINVNPPEQSITIHITPNGQGGFNYGLEPKGFTAPDNALLIHSAIFHLSQVVINCNMQLAQAHENMLQLMAAEAAKHGAVARN